MLGSSSHPAAAAKGPLTAKARRKRQYPPRRVHRPRLLPLRSALDRLARVGRERFDVAGPDNGAARGLDRAFELTARNDRSVNVGSRDERRRHGTKRIAHGRADFARAGSYRLDAAGEHAPASPGPESNGLAIAGAIDKGLGSEGGRDVVDAPPFDVHARRFPRLEERP